MITHGRPDEQPEKRMPTAANRPRRRNNELANENSITTHWWKLLQSLVTCTVSRSLALFLSSVLIRAYCM